MKISLRFWQNRHCKTGTLFVLLLAGNALHIKVECSESKNVSPPKLAIKTPGVVESLKTLVQLNKEQLRELDVKLKSAPKLLSSIPNLSDIRIDPYYLKSILFYSEKRYTSLIKNENICTFYSLIENNLIRSVENKVSNIPIIYQTKDGLSESAITLKDDLLQYMYNTKCYQNRETAELFALDNFDKTINNLKFRKPDSINACTEIITNWRENPFLPYICNIPEVISRAHKIKLRIDNDTLSNLQKDGINGEDIKTSKLYLEKISPANLSYIQTLCSNLDSSETFCNYYLQPDLWKKVISKDIPDYHMTYICKNILQKDTLDQQSLFECHEHIKNNPSLCETNGSLNYPAAFPRPSCDEIAQIAEISNLYSDYHDCPGRIDNEATTNIHRIVSHFDKKQIPSSPQTCLSNTNQTLVNLAYAFNNSENWPLKICYTDKIKDKEVCLPYSPGDILAGFANESIAETNVVKHILERTTEKSIKNKCRIIPDFEYNPVLLEYAAGCFITYDTGECTTAHCPKRIFLDLKEIKGKLKYTGDQSYQYFPTSLSNDYYSTDNMLKILKKLKYIPIQNLSDLTSFLKENNENIVHGVGCAEDIHPARFKKITINQCRTLPFIVGGTIPDKIKPKVILTSSIMDVHSPITIDWNLLFNAVKNYQLLHPTKLWTLHGIKKE